jgi:type IV pilus assembly protein PilM
MALPFLNSRKRHDQIVAVDLGGRTTKAVHLQRRGNGFALARFAVADAPLYDKGLSADLLSEHLKVLVQSLQCKTSLMAVSLDVNDTIVRHAEMPLMPVADMRQILKTNPKAYLQQELTGFVFDCHLSGLNGNAVAKAAAEKAKTGLNLPKQRTLVAAAREQLVKDVQSAVRSAGMAPESVVPGLICVVNAFELAMPEVFAKESVALVDIGFRSTSICLLQEGELILSRVVAIGGDKLTSGLAEMMGISYAEAESIKVGIPTEVQSQLEALVLPLGRELRASIDCFEHQQDKAISQVFVSGASAQSDLLVSMLQTELMAECKRWNPMISLQLALPPEQTAQIEQTAPQLTVALGAALAVL